MYKYVCIGQTRRIHKDVHDHSSIRRLHQCGHERVEILIRCCFRGDYLVRRDDAGDVRAAMARYMRVSIARESEKQMNDFI